MKPEAPRPIRVLLVDDHALFREGMARLLENEPDLKLVAHCASVREALDLVTSRHVDIVLLDFDLGATGKGTEFLLRANEKGFRGRTLILTAGVSDAEARRLVSLGASGIFPKHDSPGLLLQSIHQVMEGWSWLNQRVLEALVAPAESASQEPGFTKRELQVLRGILQGLQNKQIASQLSVSGSAVKATLQQLFSKTGVRTRSQLVRVALERYRDLLVEGRG